MKNLLKLASIIAMASLILVACGGIAPPPSTDGGGGGGSSDSNATDVPSVDVPSTGGGSGGNDLLADILERGYILVSSDPNYEPYSFLNTEGTRPADTKCPEEALTSAEIQGFDIDVAVAVGTAMGVETCFPTPSWDLITAGSWADKWDVSIGSMTVTSARQEVLYFSIPYYYQPAVIAVTTDSGFDSLDDLAGQPVCAGVSTTYEAWLNNDMETLGLPEASIYASAPEGVTVVPLETDQLCAQSINEGRDDFQAYVTGEGVVDANIADGIPVTKLDGAIYSEDLAAAFDKSATPDTTSFREKVDEVLAQLHSDGTLANLSTKWLGADLTQDPSK